MIQSFVPNNRIIITTVYSIVTCTKLLLHYLGNDIFGFLNIITHRDSVSI